MDMIQAELIKAGHKDLAQQYYKKVAINRSQAYKKDVEWAKKHKENPFYIDKDKDGTECIFGAGSEDFMYSSPTNAEKEVKEKFENLKRELADLEIKWKN